MEPISTILIVALGHILKGALESKAANTAKEELTNAFWQWIRPFFIKDIPEIEENPNNEEIRKKTEQKLLELIKDEDFFNELAERVNELSKAGIKEKNIFEGDLINVKKIRIGDKEYKPDEVYNRKNIFNGKVDNADDFTLGDG